MQAQDYIIALIQGGMTQAQIALDVGLSQPTISRIASGKRADIRKSAHDKIVSLFRRHQRRTRKPKAVQ